MYAYPESHSIIEKPAVDVGIASLEEIQKLITIHRYGIPYSFNSRLGSGHMALIYRLVLNDPSCALLSARIKGIAVGVCIATLDREALSQKLMRELPIAHWFKMCVAALRSPGLVAEWLDGLWAGMPVYVQGKVVRAGLLAIAVDPTFRYKGVGASLVKGVDGFCWTANCSAYRLEARSNNGVARKFYQREGFYRVAERGRNTVWVRKISC